MDKFIIKNLENVNAQTLSQIGFDESYKDCAVNKFCYKNFKIFNLSLPQATILKQTAISTGADCALNKGVLTSSVEKTDCILGGSYTQLKKIAQKLKKQPFSMKELADSIEKILAQNLLPLQIKSKTFDYSRPYICGILNITDNSFSDGGNYIKPQDAIKKLEELISDGADLIDIGTESTKPYSKEVSANIQIERLSPVLKYIKENNIQIPISIDTRSSAVAEFALKNGADIINDVSGFDFDKKMVEIIAKYQAKIIIQHCKGTPENMQDNPTYENLTDEIFTELNNKVNLALKNGIHPQNIIIDLGIGFGKTQAQNFELIEKINDFKSLNCPIMIGLSRKSLLDMKDCSNEEKDIFSLALNATIIDKANFLRVHNVKLHKKLLNLKFIK